MNKKLKKVIGWIIMLALTISLLMFDRALLESKDYLLVMVAAITAGLVILASCLVHEGGEEL